MEDNIQKKSITDQIIVAAKNGRLKMRPKWHFILQAALGLVGIAVVSMTLLYLTSLFIFISHETGIMMAPIFGWHGIAIFLVSLPWLLILALVVFFLILEILVRHYAFAYRLPLLYSGLAILIVVSLTSLVVAATPFHEKLSHCPPVGGPPPCVIGFYRDLGPDRIKNVHRGTITGFEGSNFVIINRNREELTIVVSPRTRLPRGLDFSLGDEVVVIGDRQGDQVKAFGVIAPAR